MSPIRQQFIEYLTLKGYSKDTLSNYVQAISRLARFFNKPPLSLTHDDINRFLLHLKEDLKLAPKTINLTFYSLRCFYGHFLPDSPIMKGFGRMKEQIKIPAILSKEEVEKLINSCLSLKTKAVIAVLYSSGIRVAECSSLNIADIDRDRMVLHVRLGKGGKDRLAVLSERTLLLLEQYYRACRPKVSLFENNRHTRPLAKRRIQQIVCYAGRAAGIRKPVTPHILRHSFATHQMEAGVPLQVIQQLLGHINIQTTSRYSHVSADFLNSYGSPFDKKRKPDSGKQS